MMVMKNIVKQSFKYIFSKIVKKRFIHLVGKTCFWVISHVQLKYVTFEWMEI